MPKASELVTVGPHRLFLGDAYRIRAGLGWMDADVMDPPYLFRAAGGGRYRKDRPKFDQIEANGLNIGFDMTIINPLLSGAAVVFAHNDQFQKLLERLNGCFHRNAILVWEKINPQPIANRHYRPDSELYIHAWRKDFYPRGDLTMLGRITRCSSPRMGQKFGHPTVKPNILMDKIVANVAGLTICDPFMGTASTGVAAIKAGRIFTGIEHNPAHFATAVRRIEEAYARHGEKAAA